MSRFPLGPRTLGGATLGGAVPDRTALGVAVLTALLLSGCSAPERDAATTTVETRQDPATNDSPAGAEAGRAAAIERLAGGVADYSARARLIRLGPAALPALLRQSISEDDVLAAESISTVRWLVHHWRDDTERAPEISAELVAFTGSEAEAERRAFAVDLLGDLGDDRSVERLTELLADAELQETAALALGRIEGAAAREALLAEAARSSELRPLAYSILGRRGEAESIPPLLEAASSDDDAVAALAGFDDPAVITWLAEAASGGSSSALAALLASEVSARDGALLARLVRATSGDARESVLSRIRAPEQYDSELVAALLAVPTRGSTGRGRDRALLSLAGEMDPAVSAQVALEALDRHRDASVIVPALEVCASRCSAGAAGPIAAKLDDDDPTVRMAAVTTLSRLDGDEASTALSEAIRRSAPDQARPMIRALSQRRDAAAAEALLGLMQEPVEELRAALLRAALTMAPRLDNPRHAARVWARSLDLRITPEALDGLALTGGAAEVPRLETVVASSSGETYASARRALVGTGRRLAQAGQAEAAVSALGVAFDEGAAVGSDLRRLGERIELVAHGGRIDAWWRLANASPSGGCSRAEPPLAALAALGTPSPGEATWRSIEASDSRGVTTLVAADPDSPVWLAADVLPRGAVPVGIQVRSTDEVAVWLDGSLLTPEDDTEEDAVSYAGRLARDGSRLLVRLCGARQGSTLAMRLEDESGRPLKFRIR